MYRYLYLLSVCCLPAFVWQCNPKGEEAGPQTGSLAALTASERKVETSDPLLPDSIITYRPVVGSGAVVPQFPFRLTNSSATSVRLTKVIYNGNVIRDYKYNELGRLAERTDYYTNGIQIYKKFAYRYATDRPIEITSQLNKEAPYVEGYPRKSELLPSTATTYALISDSLAWLKRTTVIEFLDLYQKPGTIVSRLGFSSTGALVWEEKTDERGKLSQYILYRRNASDDIVYRRKGSLSNQWEVLSLTYDDKLNPFRTTGDTQPLDFGDLSGADATNNHNVLTQSSSNSKGGWVKWNYTYTYRADNYPDQVSIYRDGRLVSTATFVYTQ